MTAHLPVGINPTVIGVEASWWIAAARRAEAAGFGTVWAWDHFVSRGDLADPLLECWTTLTAAAVSTRRIHVGSFVANVMNRHPAVLARIVATLADLAAGRVELGIGIGGHPAEHRAYGLDFPPPQERAARLEEAIAVLRLLFSGGPVDFEGRYYRLEGAHAFPVPQPAPRITVAGMKPAGARSAARLGDAWTCFAPAYDQLLPVFEAELAAAGRSRADVPIVVGIDVQEVGGDIDALTARWRDKGASELVIHDVGPAQLQRILDLL
jgi:alkanesulfonate monooxygenase SsuD/methylene tetrahydromethanopterin reductase-like flavin-dependent oxidoreductase (luciferase family)